jgi:hypothetical protein
MDNDTFVTIVSGLPRSGTSMMMRMLEAGGLPVIIDGVRQADEDNPRGYYEFEPAKRTREDASWLKTAGGRVVKMVYRLLYDLPGDYRYRVVFMRRNIEEVLASQKKMLHRSGREGGGIDDAQMAALFAKELEKFAAWIARQPNFSIHDVSYNDLLSEPMRHLLEIDRFLGNRLDVEAMARVVEPGLYRNRTATVASCVK